MNRKRIAVFCGVFAALAGATAVLLRPPVRRPGGYEGAARPQVDTEQFGEGARAVLPADGEKVVLTTANLNEASAWSRFRGPNGTGVSADNNIPTAWSDQQNLVWKTRLPGPGSSSPVLTEKYVFVTTYSGYGEDKQNPGSMAKLQRELVCIQRVDGKVVWTRAVEANHPEDPYQGMGVPEHGYATNSPVTDGQNVYAFLGKSGVLAFDLDGNQLWRVSVGTESGNRGWGTAASLMLCNNLLIVNAAEESHAIIALDKASGKEVWRAEASTLELCYGTPAIALVDENREEIVLAVPGEIWGLNPRSGKLSWFAQTSMTDNLSPSVVIDGKKIYAFGGYRSSGSLALEAGGKGDVTQSKVLWTSRNSSYVATPALHAGRLYWIDDRGMYYCADAQTGELVHRARMPGITSGDRPVYASPIVINGKIYAQTRTSGLYVIEPSEELKVIAQNRFESDDSLFNATPAVDSGQLFLRSNRYLYCIGQVPSEHAP